MLTQTKALALETKATIDWTKYQDDVLEYLEDVSPSMWRKTFVPLIKGVVTDQVKSWAALLGLEFDVMPLFARSWFMNYVNGSSFIQIAQTTAAKIGELIDLALKEGWSIPRMQESITEAFGIFEDYRSERIARTEVIRASNAGSTDQFKAWGVKRHEWLSTQDDRTRTTPPDEFDHKKANGEVVEIGQPFMWTGEPLMYPGDPAGSAANIIQCRCTTLPVIEGFDDA